MSKMIFKFQDQDVDISMEINTDGATLTAVLHSFKHFLKSTGYVIDHDAELELVGNDFPEEEDFEDDELDEDEKEVIDDGVDPMKAWEKDKCCL